MSKKNLSLLMDGFVGDTNQSESIQEESKEQAEQPAVQTDKQENLETAPSKIASKKEATETEATEKRKSQLEAKRRENVSYPKKGKTAKSVKKPQEIRTTFIVDPDLVRKVKYISLVKGILLKDVISEALNNYVEPGRRRTRKYGCRKRSENMNKTEHAVTVCSVLLLYAKGCLSSCIKRPNISNTIEYQSYHSK